MSWIKIILTIISLYFLAVLQNSFFTQFSFFGAVPNLVFIFFFLLLFFSNKNWEIIFFAAAAGFFLDIFSYIFLGASAVLLLFIGFLAKRL